MLKILPFLTLILILFGCQPSVTFTEPQPKGAKHLDRIPSKLSGHYLSEDKASFIVISDRLIVQTYDYDLKTAKTDLLPHQKLVGDSLENTETGSRDFVMVTGDSLVQHIHETDTLFLLSDGQVLTKFKGYYFLNTKWDQNWYVRQLSLSKGVLKLAEISTSEEIDNLRQITGTEEDSTIYNFSPGKEEFRNFINQDGFHKKSRFYRISR
ncbi:MAG TPA: hypothetical protein PKI35_05900 [Bacteroidales bacterium]|nr:hypothetical protein [Bacteroidales bacterium]